MCLPYVKRYFQEHQLSAFLFVAQITQILLFSVTSILQRSKITVWERHLFKKKLCYGSFRYVSTLRKKVSSKAPMKWFSLYESNNSDSVLLENDGFAEIKDYSFRTTPFQKKIVVEVSSLCLPYVKRYFQAHRWSAFLFMAQITQILLFSGMPVLQRSKITVWEWKLFKNKFIYGSFWFVSTLRKKIFPGAPMKYFSLYGSKIWDIVVFDNAGFAEIKYHSLRVKSFQK